ncbi:hypothetical protein N7448_000550 [Penicillium atrosanguineum]|nr:hypothetical protein N7448_000550 [Penicillium atrosanguineum]
MLAARPSMTPSVAPSPGPGTPGSITTKEWVIPPRPKPGRKPATDTPPTKRKAQNRAAQRAFRERRAARVQELEEQMKEIEDGHDIRIAAFTEQVSNLSREVEQCREEIGWWRDRCHSLEKEVSIERSAKEAIVKEFRTSISGSSSAKLSSIPDSVPLPPRNRPSTRSSRMEGVESTNAERNREEGAENVPLGCSSCSNTHCQCIEDAFAMPNDAFGSTRPRHPPHGVGSPQRELAEPVIKPDPEEMEIDFTSRFAGVPAQSSSHNHNNEISSPPVDPCGFCQDGTPCICAEMAAQEQQRGRRSSFEAPPPRSNSIHLTVHPSSFRKRRPLGSDSPPYQPGDQPVCQRARNLRPMPVRPSQHPFLQDAGSLPVSERNSNGRWLLRWKGNRRGMLHVSKCPRHPGHA